MALTPEQEETRSALFLLVKKMEGEGEKIVDHAIMYYEEVHFSDPNDIPELDYLWIDATSELSDKIIDFFVAAVKGMPTDDVKNWAEEPEDKFFDIVEDTSGPIHKALKKLFDEMQNPTF